MTQTSVIYVVLTFDKKIKFGNARGPHLPNYEDLRRGRFNEMSIRRELQGGKKGKQKETKNTFNKGSALACNHFLLTKEKLLHMHLGF